MTIPRILWLSFALATILTTAACEVTQSHPSVSKTTQSGRDTDGHSLLRRSERSAPDEAARMRLAAAESFRAAGDHASAVAALDGIDPARLDGAGQFDYYNLRSLLFLDVRDYPAARQAIDLAIPLNADERNVYALTSADLAEAEQRFEDAATSLMGYSYSTHGTEVAQFPGLVERTWADVNRTPAYRISALAAQTQNANAAGWWQLADALQRSFDLDAERVAISDWRRNHRDHPASRWPPRAITLIESGVSTPNQIALLLPLSGPLANAGQAIRDGFICAFFHAASKMTVRVYDTNGVSIGALYEQAGTDGAQLVIGPLDKQSVVDINLLPYRRVPVLALNYLPPGVAPGAGLYQFGLAIEDEAREIARRIYADGLPRVAIIESDLDWSNRAAESFRSQFVTLGGTVVTVGMIKDARATTEVVGAALLVEASTQRMEALTKTIGSTPEFIARRRSDLDALVALTDPAQSRALNSAMAFYFAADVPIYATSQSAGAGSANALGDLNGLRLTELPWQVYPSAIRKEVESAFANSHSSMSPLYALGVDAFRLSDRADLMIPNSPGRLLGETGQLQVQGSGVVTREPAWAVVQHGALVAMPTVVP
jgi:outer membrane PBP1 activator LpoA protein